MRTMNYGKNDWGRWRIVLWSVSMSCLTLGAARAQPVSDLTLRSSSPLLDESFAWAKTKALSCVRTGQRPDYIPCYFAAMSDSQFCVRDVAHMMEGAHLLGLDAENWSMMNLFACGANRRVKQDYYWPRWHNPYTGKSGKNADDFGSCQWRTLPAPFDMAWRCYEQYLWTGNDQWVRDPEMFQYHTNLHTKFMEHQKWNDSPAADELNQLASYFEFPNAGEHFIEAGDAIGCQYQSLLAYANILKARGDDAGAESYRSKADRLRAYFETHWFDAATGRYIRGFDRFGAFRSDWGHENSFFLPMSLITDQGPRTAAYLDFIEASIARQPLNIEATTYLPEVYYKHGRNETAWKYLKQVMKTRNGYPEVSFTCVGNTIAGMMGVWPDAPHRTVATSPRLPAGLTWVEADHVPVGGNELFIAHYDNIKSTLKNQRGPAIHWQARFYGNFPTFLIEGVERTATVTTLNGKTISYATVLVGPGKTVNVQALGPKGPDLPSPPSPPLQPEPPPPVPAPGTYYLSERNWRYAAARSGQVVRVSPAPEGKPVAISGVKYSRGLCVHGLSAIRYDLHRQYSRFLCDVGFVEPANDQGAVEFEVYGGTNLSALLYSSGVLRVHPASGMRHVNIDVSDCDYIVLGVRNAGDGDNGNDVCWANARLIARGSSTATQPPTTPQNLHAAQLDHSSAELEWTASTGHVAVAGYDIYCGTRNVGSSNSPRYRVTDLNPNATYEFTVKAWDADGNTSAASEALAVTTPLPPDLVYMSQLNWTSATIGSGSIGRDRNCNGGPIKLKNATYEHGIGTHAVSKIVYDLASLGRSYARFVSDVGIDGDQKGSVVFQVFADEKKVFDSQLVTAASPIQKIDVSIAGVKRLALVVTDGGDGINSDHADWADARLVAR